MHSPAGLILNGYRVPATPRTEEEMEQGKVTLSRYQRGTDAAERRKIRECSIGSLKVKIGLVEYDALADAKAADLGALVLKH